MINLKQFASSSQRNKVVALAAAGIVAVVGYTVLHSHAASFFSASEPESGSLATNAHLVNDAAASGGKAVQFSAAASSGGGGGTNTGACTGSRNTPGGPDPWGGCFPGASNTGIPAGTALSTYTGPMTVTANGTVIDAKTISGDLQIKASGVIIKNSKINGDVRIDSSYIGQPYSFTIQDSEVDAGRALGQDAYDGTGVGAINFTALRVNVHGGKLSVNCFYHCTVKDSYLYGQQRDSTGTAHEGAIRVGDTSNTIHTTLLCDAPDVAPDAGCSGDYTGYGDFSPVQNNLTQYNLIMASTAGFCAYGGASAGKPYSGNSNNLRYLNNVFQRGTSKSDHGYYVCGYYGYFTDFDPAKPGNQWSGNVFDDGTALDASGTTH
jgi:hypothetical protein